MKIAGLWVAVAFCSSIPLFGPTADAVPERAESVVEGAKPAWVAESLAIDAGGKLRLELFEEHLLVRFRNSPRSQDCAIHMQPSPLEQYVRLESLEDLVRTSRHVVIGEIVGARQGFLFGLAGTLYAIQPSPTNAGGRALLFLPTARIKAAGGDICSKMAEDVAVPQLGDRVIAFIHLRAVDRDGSILELDPERQLVVHRPAKTFTPRALREELSGATFDEVVERIHRMARSTSRRPKTSASVS